MGLWTVAPERLQSSACSLYKVPLKLIEQGTKGTASMIQKPLDTITGFVPGLQSGLDTANVSKDRNTGEPNKDTAQRKTQEGQLTIPRIPFVG